MADTAIVPVNAGSVEHVASLKGFRLLGENTNPAADGLFYGMQGATKGFFAPPSASGAAEDDLTSGVVAAKVYRNGGSATTISNPGAGEYNLSIKSGAAFRGADVFGNNTTLNGSNEFILRLDNSLNSEDRWPLVQLYDANTGALVDQHATSTNHAFTVSGNITTITLPGMNLFGATGFRLIVR